VSTEIGLRNIETVRAGERVWAYDHLTGEWRLARVIDQFTHVHDGELVRVSVAGDVIESTPHHPYWVERGEDLDARPRPEHVPENPAGYTGIGRWVDAADVRTGDVLRLRSGELVPIVSVEVRRWRGRVYNFHVEELQCYAVGGAMVLVHNNSHTPHDIVTGPSANKDIPWVGKPNSILEHHRPDGGKHVGYYDDQGRLFSRADYGQVKPHNKICLGPDGKALPHEHRYDYSEKGPTKQWYREIDTHGMPVGPWILEK
jgi:hypothetical protein